MLYLLREGQEKALPLEPSTQGFTEGELRTLINCLPELLGEDLFILNFEFGGFSPAGNRAGVLALGRNGRKFVVELRQGEADASELKALEYAATYARATVADLADAYSQGKVHTGKRPSAEAALAELKQYLEEGDHTNGLDPEPAIVVFASDFRPEFYNTVMFLKDRGVNISCARFRGYHVDDSWVIDVEHDSPFCLEAGVRAGGDKEAGREASTSTSTGAEAAKGGAGGGGNGGGNGGGRAPAGAASGGGGRR